MSARKEVTAHDLHLRSQHDILARQWPVHPAAFFLSCTVSEIAGGDFGLTLVHPITEDLRWKELQEERIIEAPVPAYKPLEDDGTVIVPAEQATEQCFRIYSVSVDTANHVVTVYYCSTNLILNYLRAINRPILCHSTL